MKAYEEEAIKNAKEAGCEITELTKAEAEKFRKAGKEVNEVVCIDSMDTIEWLTE